MIEPIVAVCTEDGQIRVRHGHRRTLAAIEAAKPLVPVFIAGLEDNDEADRIARQWHENKHRSALTNVVLSIIGSDSTQGGRGHPGLSKGTAPAPIDEPRVI